MSFARTLVRWGCCTAAIACFALPSIAADKDGKKEAEAGSYYGPQPATENIDLNMYARIREEGFSTAGDAVRRRAGKRHRPAAHRLAEHGEGERVDARHADGDRAEQCAPGGLGRVRHGLAADQHLGADGLARPGAALDAGRAVVARDQRARSRARSFTSRSTDASDLDK